MIKLSEIVAVRGGKVPFDRFKQMFSSYGSKNFQSYFDDEHYNMDEDAFKLKVNQAEDVTDLAIILHHFEMSLSNSYLLLLSLVVNVPDHIIT